MYYYSYSRDGASIFIILFFYALAILAHSCIFGFATKAVISNKGYHENWFWWGFFFGLIALIVALSKPQCAYYPNPHKDDFIIRRPRDLSDGYSSASSGENWQCTCGRTHAFYVTSCPCGKSKREILHPTADSNPAVPTSPAPAASGSSSALSDGGWKCSCGRTHAFYVTSCPCGKSKREILHPTADSKPAVPTSPAAPAVPAAPSVPSAPHTESEESKIAAIKEYKKLMDEGILTEEEFTAKKKSLLQ